MKKVIFLVTLSVFIMGCGGSQEQSASQGQAGKQDYITMGFQQLENKDLPKAIQSFDLAIKQDPHNIKNYLLLGEVYLRLKNYPSAEDTFVAATKVEPNNGDGFYYLAMSRAAQADKKQQAIAAAKKSVELYMQSKNEDAFKRAVVLLRTLEAPNGSVPVQN